MDGELFRVSVSETTQNCQFGDTTLRGYCEPLQTLNGELVLITAPKILNYVTSFHDFCRDSG